MEYILFLLYFITSITIVVIFLNWLSQWLFGYEVPFIRSSNKNIEVLLKNLKLKSWDNFLDLWSWDGKVLEAISNKFNDVNIHWIENSFFPYLLSQKNKKLKNLNYIIYKKDFFDEDFSKYNVIYSYTIPYLMNKIWKKVKSECREWTLFYSNSFCIKWEKEFKKIKIKEDTFLYIYKV